MLHSNHDIIMILCDGEATRLLEADIFSHSGILAVDVKAFLSDHHMKRNILKIMTKIWYQKIINVKPPTPSYSIAKCLPSPKWCIKSARFRLRLNFLFLFHLKTDRQESGTIQSARLSTIHFWNVASPRVLDSCSRLKMVASLLILSISKCQAGALGWHASISLVSFCMYNSQATTLESQISK